MAYSQGNEYRRTTISIMLASTSILGSAITGLSLGLQYILNILKSLYLNHLSEINKLILFQVYRKIECRI